MLQKQKEDRYIKNQWHILMQDCGQICAIYGCRTTIGRFGTYSPLLGRQSRMLLIEKFREAAVCLEVGKLI